MGVQEDVVYRTAGCGSRQSLLVLLIHCFVTKYLKKQTSLLGIYFLTSRMVQTGGFRSVVRESAASASPGNC